MSKPGPLEIFNSGPYDIDEWVKQCKVSLDAFADNMKHLKISPLSKFEWFYTFGYWNEALEYIDEFPEYFGQAGGLR